MYQSNSHRHFPFFEMVTIQSVETFHFFKTLWNVRFRSPSAHSKIGNVENRGRSGKASFQTFYVKFNSQLDPRLFFCLQHFFLKDHRFDYTYSALIGILWILEGSGFLDGLDVRLIGNFWWIRPLHIYPSQIWWNPFCHFQFLSARCLAFLIPIFSKKFFQRLPIRLRLATNAEARTLAEEVPEGPISCISREVFRIVFDLRKIPTYIFQVVFLNGNIGSVRAMQWCSQRLLCAYSAVEPEGHISYFPCEIWFVVWPCFQNRFSRKIRIRS